MTGSCKGPIPSLFLAGRCRERPWLNRKGHQNESEARSFFVYSCWKLWPRKWVRYCLVTYPCPIHPNWVDSSEALNDSTRFARRRSALPEVKISEIIYMNLPQSIRMRRFTTLLDSHGVAIRVDSTTFKSTLHSPGALYFLSKRVRVNLYLNSVKNLQLY